MYNDAFFGFRFLTLTLDPVLEHPKNIENVWILSKYIFVSRHFFEIYAFTCILLIYSFIIITFPASYSYGFECEHLQSLIFPVSFIPSSTVM